MITVTEKKGFDITGRKKEKKTSKGCYFSCVFDRSEILGKKSNVKIRDYLMHNCALVYFLIKN